MVYFKLLLHSHTILVGIIGGIFLIEVLWNKLILVRWFLYKKNPSVAEGTANRESLLYFLYQFGFVFYLDYTEHLPADFRYWIWGIIIFVLATVVWALYSKFQGVDPENDEVYTMKDVWERMKK